MLRRGVRARGVRARGVRAAAAAAKSPVQLCAEVKFAGEDTSQQLGLADEGDGGVSKSAMRWLRLNVGVDEQCGDELAHAL